MIDIQQEKLLILELIKNGKSGCIYPGTDLFNKTNIVSKAYSQSDNSERICITYLTEEFFFGSENEIRSCKFDFERDPSIASLFNDFDFFRTMSIENFFVLMETVGCYFNEFYPVREEWDTIARFSLDRDISVDAKIDEIVALVNYETGRLWTLGISLLYKE